MLIQAKQFLIGKGAIFWVALRYLGTRAHFAAAAGKKLYAVRDAKGKFKDIQTYERAHKQDIKTQEQGRAQEEEVTRRTGQALLRRPGI